MDNFSGVVFIPLKIIAREFNKLNTQGKKDVLKKLKDPNFNTRRTEGQVGSGSRPDIDPKYQAKYVNTNKADVSTHSVKLAKLNKKAKAEFEKDGVALKKLATKRREGITKRDKFDKVTNKDAYYKANKEGVIDVSEELGDMAVQAHMIFVPKKGSNWCKPKKQPISSHAH